MILVVQDVDLHDAAYFRLNRSEAIALDPQTRLLLEVWLLMHHQFEVIFLLSARRTATHAM